MHGVLAWTALALLLSGCAQSSPIHYGTVDAVIRVHNGSAVEPTDPVGWHDLRFWFTLDDVQEGGHRAAALNATVSPGQDREWRVPVQGGRTYTAVVAVASSLWGSGDAAVAGLDATTCGQGAFHFDATGDLRMDALISAQVTAEIAAACG